MACFCYYIIEITDITVKGLALAVTCIAGKEGTRQTKGCKQGKGQALVWICSHSSGDRIPSLEAREGVTVLHNH